eukprot:101591-Prorocentrum_minimum.AAC.3
MKNTFIVSHMIVSDEVNNRQRLITIDFVEFLECLCRVADALQSPSAEELNGEQEPSMRSDRSDVRKSPNFFGNPHSEAIDDITDHTCDAALYLSAPGVPFRVLIGH